MTKIVVNATHKGGEGKTTNSIMLAEYAALILKLRTLIIDLDPQANFSGRYVKMEYDPANKGGKIPPYHPDYEPDVDRLVWPQWHRQHLLRRGSHALPHGYP